MNMPCAYEGPRGAWCDNDATCRVHSDESDMSTGHVSAYSCDDHRNHFRAEVVRDTGQDAIVSPVPVGPSPDVQPTLWDAAR